MNQTEAMKIIDAAVHGFQRYRSIAKESLPEGTSERILEATDPWVFGPKSALPALLKMQARGKVTRQELTNVLYILWNFVPAAKVAAEIELEMDFPEVMSITEIGD